ncbi:MAG: glycosyltransferase family 61 protein [Paracraurococcus sp.]
MSQFSANSRIFTPPAGAATPVSNFIQVAAAYFSGEAAPLIRPDLSNGHDSIHKRASGDVPPQGFHCLKDALVGHEGIVYSSDRRIFAPPDVMPAFPLDVLHQRIARNDDQDPAVAVFAAPPSSFRVLDENFTYVLVTKAGESVYGHWIIDMMPRIWLFQKYAHLFQKPFRFLVTKQSPEWAFKMMSDGLGISHDMIEVWHDRMETVHVRDLVVPSILRTDFAFSPLVNLFADSVRQRLQISEDPGEPHRFFITRENVHSWSPRAIGNRSDILDVLQQHGVELLDPAALPWPEQVQRFNQATLAAGEFGSGLHTTLFAGRRTANLVLAYSHMNALQSAIAAVRGQPIGYLGPTHEEVRDGCRVCTYDPNALSDMLTALAEATA